MPVGTAIFNALISPIYEPPKLVVWEVIEKARLAPNPEKYLAAIGHDQIVRMVRAGLNVRSPNGELPLNAALKAGFPLKIIQIMLGEGTADPLLKDRDGNNAFFCTFDINAWILLKRYSRVDFQQVLKEKNETGNTLPLHIVDTWEEGDQTLKALDYLIEKHATIPEDIATNRFTLLQDLATTGTKLKSVERLLKMGFPVQFDGIRSSSKKPLYHALANKHVAFASLLIRYEASCNQEIWEQIYHVFNLCPGMDSSYTELAELVLEKFDLTKFGWTSLHFAAFTGLSDELLELHRDDAFLVYSTCDERDSTPLHLAARKSHILSVFYLIEIAHADLFAKDSDGEMPAPEGVYDPLHDLLRIYRRNEISLGARNAAIRDWTVGTLTRVLKKILELQKKGEPTIFYEIQWRDLKTMLSFQKTPSRL